MCFMVPEHRTDKSRSSDSACQQPRRQHEPAGLSSNWQHSPNPKSTTYSLFARGESGGPSKKFSGFTSPCTYLHNQSSPAVMQTQCHLVGLDKPVATVVSIIAGVTGTCDPHVVCKHASRHDLGKAMQDQVDRHKYQAACTHAHIHASKPMSTADHAGTLVDH